MSVKDRAGLLGVEDADEASTALDSESKTEDFNLTRIEEKKNGTKSASRRLLTYSSTLNLKPWPLE